MACNILLAFKNEIVDSEFIPIEITIKPISLHFFFNKRGKAKSSLTYNRPSLEERAKSDESNIPDNDKSIYRRLWS